MIKIIFKDFLQFLIKPNSREIDFGRNKVLKKILFLICMIPFVWITGVLLLFAGNFILTVLGVTPPEVEGIGGKVPAEKAGLSLMTMYIAGAIIAPITEEIRFRLPLKFSRFFISASIAMFSLSRIFSLDFYTGGFDWHYILTQIIISIALFLVIYYVLGIKKVNNFIQYHVYEKNLGILFYALIIYFGIIHFNSEHFSLYMITSTMPQMVTGVYLGYARLKYGFGYAVLMHILWNSITILI